MYNAEMAPAHLRGGMNILFQLSVTVGILAAGLINYGCDFIHPWGWRLSLGLAGMSPSAVPVIAQLHHMTIWPLPRQVLQEHSVHAQLCMGQIRHWPSKSCP